jgi:hypothetical protein
MNRQLIHVQKNNVNDKDINELMILQEEFAFKKKEKDF